MTTNTTSAANLEDAQRTRIVNSTARLEASTRRLENSHRIALDTEEIGVGIVGDLKRQSEQLQRTKATLDESEGYVDRSMKVLKDMSRR